MGQRSALRNIRIVSIGDDEIMTEQIEIDFELTKEERMVWEIVRQHRGRENAILGPVIAQMTGLKYDEVRHIISHLVNEHGCFIASCSRGYYIPVTAEESEQATKSLRHRGIMILMRAARLQKKSLEEVFGQGKLEYENAQRQQQK